MAEPVRLYSLALHFGLRLLTAGFGGFAAVVAVMTVLAGERQPVAFVAIGVIMISMGVFARIVWRTRPLLIDGEHLVIGRGARRRRIAFDDVLSCGHPWWVFSDRFAAPLELTLRGADTVTFFPELGAADMIRARLRA
jgi:hypothetical protein